MNTFALLACLAAPLGDDSYTVRHNYERQLDSLGPLCLPVAAIASQSKCAETAARGQRLWKRNDHYSIYLIAYFVTYGDYGAGPTLPSGYRLNDGDRLIDAMLDITGVPGNHSDREWIKKHQGEVTEQANVIRESVRGLRDYHTGVAVARWAIRPVHSVEPPK